MITSNIVKPEMNVSSDSGGFYLVSDSLRSYAEMVRNLFNDENGQGGNDHFISTRSSISEVWTLFQSKGLSDAGVLQKLTQKEALKSWFSVIVCMISSDCMTNIISLLSGSTEREGNISTSGGINSFQMVLMITPFRGKKIITMF